VQIRLVDTEQALGNGVTEALALGDLDGDGDLDLVCGNILGGPTRLWQNDGHGRFVALGPALPRGFEAHGLDLGDVDDDGDLDLAVATFGSNPNRLFLNDGKGHFVDAGQGISNADTKALVFGDVDGDGDLDVVLANWGHPGGARQSPNEVWINDGQGRFTDSDQRLGAQNSEDLLLGDVDGDGDLDLVVANFTGAPNEVWINNGAGVFVDSGQRLGDGDTTCLALGDLDMDGDLDLISGNLGFGVGAPDLVWLNDGSGTFIDSGQRLGLHDTTALLLTDLDGDGDLDVLVGDNTHADAVYRNEGGGVLHRVATDFGTDPIRATHALRALDEDGDGVADLIFEGTSSATKAEEGAPNLVWRVQRPGDPRRR